MQVRCEYHGPRNRLTSADGARIVAELERALPRFDVGQYFGSQPGIFPAYDHVALAHDEAGCCVGMLASRWLEGDGLRFLYLWTAMVATDLRRTSVFKTLVAEHFGGIVADTRQFPGLVVTKTYNPVVYGMMKKMLAPIPGVEFYPRLDGVAASEEIRALAARLAVVLCPTLEYRLEPSVVVGGQAVLAPQYFPEMQYCDDTAVWQHFQQHLTRDDQVLCVVRVSEEAKRVVEAVLAGLPEHISAVVE